MENRYYKVAHNGMCFVTGLLFNPVTKETKRVKLADFDDDRIGVCSEWYYAPIDEEIRKLYYRHIGVILVGDVVEVYKGRKVPIGTISKVVRIYDWRDAYGRTQTTYVVFEDGRKTNIDNCRLIAE